MPHLLLLSAQIPCGELRRINLNRNALDYFQAGFFERAQLQWIVRDHAHLAKSQVVEYLGALSVLARVDCQPQQFIGFDSISTLILQSVGANLVENSDTAALLLLVDNRSATLFLDH